ncbi:hypothetical protein D3C85_1222240 [compost metagenome]
MRLIFSPVTVIGAISIVFDCSAAHALFIRQAADPTANAIVFFLKFTPRSPATDILFFSYIQKAVFLQRAGV